VRSRLVRTYLTAFPTSIHEDIKFPRE
jgi:hypothetical protein